MKKNFTIYYTLRQPRIALIYTNYLLIFIAPTTICLIFEEKNSCKFVQFVAVQVFTILNQM
jgi:hypothetical protein